MGSDRPAQWTRASSWLAQAGHALASVVFPSDCRLCERVLVNGSRVPICPECLASFVPLPSPICRQCGRAILSEHILDASQALCRLCRLGVYGFSGARSYALYDDAMVRAVVLLKHEPIAPLAEWFADRLAEVFRCYAPPCRFDLLVPVPLHAARQRERGYNQAELIARPLAKRLKLKFHPSLLERVRPRPDGLRLSARQRWTTVRGAFVARPGDKVDNLRVLLVDDVMTTGATLDACARVLQKAGVAEVYALTVARAQRIGLTAPASVSREQGTGHERSATEGRVGSAGGSGER